MRNIAIIGAGQAGLHLGFGLLDKGYRVTIHSDRTPEQVLHGRLPSTAFIFESTLRMERALGLNFWEDQAPYGEGIHVDFRDPAGQAMLTVQGRLHGKRGQALDQRTKFSRWMDEFAKRGGKLVYGSVGVSELDEIAGRHDLTMVVAGKGAVTGLFERDEERSVHARPPRHLAAVLLTGPKLTGDRPWPGIPFRPLRFNFIAGAGEYFSLPFYTHTTGECRSFLFEAIPDGPMDVFGGVRDGGEMLAAMREVIARFTPDDLERLDGAEITDPGAWLKGSFTPVVRKPALRLASGRVVMGVGDTVCLNDPIAGQGANNASRMADAILKAIVAHGSAPFEADWMTEVFDRFWESSGKHTTRFTNLLLNPPPPAAMQVLGAASQNPAIADAVVGAFNNPPDFFPWIEDEAAAGAFIAERSAEHAA